jgi:hypothetical protein
MKKALIVFVLLLLAGMSWLAFNIQKSSFTKLTTANASGEICSESVVPSRDLFIIKNHEEYLQWIENNIPHCSGFSPKNFDFNKEILIGESANTCNPDSYYVEEDKKNKIIHYVTEYSGDTACYGMEFKVNWLLIDRPADDYIFKSKFINKSEYKKPATGRFF